MLLTPNFNYFSLYWMILPLITCVFMFCICGKKKKYTTIKKNKQKQKELKKSKAKKSNMKGENMRGVDVNNQKPKNKHTQQYKMTRRIKN
uniref:Uncharacterized protein n=1 Tax=Meloidogyne enterolobii TaxID=390850 RepID=A0A6V7UZ45_MELEN|nr:unnamed protein product [Meloidogyne enterolobii]